MDIETIVNPTTIGVAISSAIAWLLGKEKGKADIKKNSAETEKIILDMKIKEDDFEVGRYSKLLDRVIKSENDFQKVLLQLDEKESEIRQLRESITKLSIINQELMAELNLYKTIK